MISAFESSGADAAGVPTGSHVMLLFDPASQELVASVHTESADPEALESGLLRLLQAHGERPDGLIMEDARLALVAFPFCRALGIEPLMDEFGGDLAHLIDDATCDRGDTPPGRLADTIDALEAIGGEAAPAAFPDRLESAEDWEAALRYTSASLLIDAQQTGALEDHVFSENGTTVLEARRNVIVSLFELSEDASTATDLIDGKSFSVDIDLDNSARFGGHVMLMRRYEVAGHQAFSMAGFPSPAAERDEQISRATEALGAGPTHELLRSKGAALGSTWQHWVTRIIDATRGAGPRARPVSRDR